MYWWITNFTDVPSQKTRILAIPRRDRQTVKVAHKYYTFLLPLPLPTDGNKERREKLVVCDLAPPWACLGCYLGASVP